YADRPGRPWRHRPRNRRRRLVADCGAGVRVDRHIDRDLAKELAFFVEDLNPEISAVRHVDIPLRIGGDAVRGVELPGLIAGLAPRLEPVPVLVDFCDAGIDIAVADERVAS